MELSSKTKEGIEYFLNILKNRTALMIKKNQKNLHQNQQNAAHPQLQQQQQHQEQIQAQNQNKSVTDQQKQTQQNKRERSITPPEIIEQNMKAKQKFTQGMLHNNKKLIENTYSKPAAENQRSITVSNFYNNNKSSLQKPKQDQILDSKQSYSQIRQSLKQNSGEKNNDLTFSFAQRQSSNSSGKGNNRQKSTTSFNSSYYNSRNNSQSKSPPQKTFKNEEKKSTFMNQSREQSSEKKQVPQKKSSLFPVVTKQQGVKDNTPIVEKHKFPNQIEDKNAQLNMKVAMALEALKSKQQIQNQQISEEEDIVNSLENKLIPKQQNKKEETIPKKEKVIEEQQQQLQQNHEGKANNKTEEIYNQDEVSSVATPTSIQINQSINLDDSMNKKDMTSSKLAQLKKNMKMLQDLEKSRKSRSFIGSTSSISSVSHSKEYGEKLKNNTQQQQQQRVNQNAQIPPQPSLPLTSEIKKSQDEQTRNDYNNYVESTVKGNNTNSLPEHQESIPLKTENQNKFDEAVVVQKESVNISKPQTNKQNEIPLILISGDTPQKSQTNLIAQQLMESSSSSSFEKDLLKQEENMKQNEKVYLFPILEQPLSTDHKIPSTLVESQYFQVDYNSSVNHNKNTSKLSNLNTIKQEHQNEDNNHNNTNLNSNSLEDQQKQQREKPFQSNSESSEQFTDVQFKGENMLNTNHKNKSSQQQLQLPQQQVLQPEQEQQQLQQQQQQYTEQQQQEQQQQSQKEQQQQQSQQQQQKQEQVQSNQGDIKIKQASSKSDLENEMNLVENSKINVNSKEQLMDTDQRNNNSKSNKHVEIEEIDNQEMSSSDQEQVFIPSQLDQNSNTADQNKNSTNKQSNMAANESLDEIKIIESQSYEDIQKQYQNISPSQYDGTEHPPNDRIRQVSSQNSDVKQPNNKSDSYTKSRQSREKLIQSKSDQQIISKYQSYSRVEVQSESDSIPEEDKEYDQKQLRYKTYTQELSENSDEEYYYEGEGYERDQREYQNYDQDQSNTIEEFEGYNYQRQRGEEEENDDENEEEYQRNNEKYDLKEQEVELRIQQMKNQLLKESLSHFSKVSLSPQGIITVETSLSTRSQRGKPKQSQTPNSSQIKKFDSIKNEINVQPFQTFGKIEQQQGIKRRKLGKKLMSLKILFEQQIIDLDIFDDDSAFTAAERVKAQLQRSISREQTRALANIICSKINQYAEQFEKFLNFLSLQDSEILEPKQVLERYISDSNQRNQSSIQTKSVKLECSNNSRNKKGEIIGKLSVELSKSSNKKATIIVREEDDPTSLAMEFIKIHGIKASKANFLSDQILDIKKEYEKNKSKSIDENDYASTKSNKYSQYLDQKVEYNHLNSRQTAQSPNNIIQNNQKELFRVQIDKGDGTSLKIVVRKGDNLKQVAYSVASHNEMSSKEEVQILNALESAHMRYLQRQREDPS